MEAARLPAAGSQAQAVPGRWLRSRLRKARNKGTMNVLSACNKNELRAHPFPVKRRVHLKICGNGSAKNDPLAASDGARQGRRRRDAQPI